MSLKSLVAVLPDLKVTFMRGLLLPANTSSFPGKSVTEFSESESEIMFRTKVF